jgi:hypothetical protein
MPELDPVPPDPATQPFADVRGRHRVRLPVDRDQTARVNPPVSLDLVRHPALGQRAQPRLFFRPGRAPRGVASVQEPGQELAVLRLAVKVPAAPEPERDPDLTAEVAMGALDIPVLVRAPNVDRAGRQAVLRQEPGIGLVEGAPGAVPVSYRRTVVGLQAARQATGTVHRLPDQSQQ